jgi:hypothetical protein
MPGKRSKALMSFWRGSGRSMGKRVESGEWRVVTTLYSLLSDH